MTPQQLISLVSGALSNGSFSLDVRTLDSADCTLIGQEYLPGFFLNLSAASIKNQTADTITVQGTGVNLPFKDLTGVEVLFYLVPTAPGGQPSVAEFSLSVVPPASWVLPQSFPPLGDSILDQFTFVQNPIPRLTLNTEPGELTALHFAGSINLAAVTGGLSTLMGMADYLVSGPIVLTAGGSGLVSMYLEGAPLDTIDLGIGTLADLTAYLSFTTVQSTLSSEQSASPFFSIAGNLPFDSMGAQASIPLLMTMRDVNIIKFQAEISSLLQATMDELMAFFNNGSISIWDQIPSDISLDSVLQLAYAYVVYDTSAPGYVSAAGIEFINRTPLTLVTLEPSGTALQLSNITFDCSIRNPLSASFSLAVDFEAEITLTGIGSIDVSASYPGWMVRGWLPTDSQIDVTQMAVVFLGAPADLPQLSINEFEFDVQPGSSGEPTTYSLALKFLMGWYVGELPVVLEEVSLAIASDGATYQAGISAGLSIAGAELALRAEYPGASGEWILSGGTAPGQQIQIANLLSSLAWMFGTDTTLPAFLEGFTISDLGTTFNTLTKDFTFHCTGNFVLYDTPVQMTVDVKILQQSNGTYSKTFAGRIVFSGFQFDLVFDTDYSKTYFIANYYNVDGGPVVVKDLIAGISANVAAAIPAGLTFNLKDALFAWESVGGVNKFLFAMDWDFGVNLSNLPLVGRYFGTDETLTMAFQVMVASDAFSADDVATLNDLVPPNTITFPAQGIADGLNLITTFRLGGQPTPITLPVDINSTSGALQTNGSTWSGGAQPLWYNIQKTFGPVYFNRVGVLYRSDNSRIYFFLDASLNTAGMSLALTGLNISTSITDFTDLGFGLDGLALDYSSGPVQIGGAFLGTTQNINGIPTSVYSGAAIAEMEGLGIAAMGSYADYNGSTSLFIYGELDAPIVVQPWLTITGISGGFGYNRSLTVPTLDNVMTFPFVEQAMSMSGGGSAKSMEEMLAGMNDYLRVEAGQYWLAAGLKFNTFKILDSFVLLTAAFGNKFQLNLIGISTLMMPPDLPSTVQPLAELQLAVLATLDWDSGYLGVSGQLTQNSFLLSRNVKLTGGFAVCTWFKGDKKGQFVATIGGYNPQYKVPAGYPVVPRLGFNWQLSDNLTLKGESYMALTSGAVMTGMNLTATWQQGSIKAWFSTSADFLLGWKPYHYDVTVAITVGAQYTFDHFGIRKTISADVGASLHLWGPDFSGVATVDLSVISFDIAFGAARPTGPRPIAWAEFESSFIPATPVGVVPSGGIVGSVTVTPLGGESRQVNILNPAAGTLSITSFIPLQYIAWQQNPNGYSTLVNVSTLLGVSPVNVPKQSGLTNLNVSLQYGTSQGSAQYVNISQYFDAVPQYGSAPAALWAGVLTPRLNDPEYVNNVLTGLLLRPKGLAITDPRDIPKVNLSMSVEAYGSHYTISGSYTEAFLSGQDNEAIINNTIVSTAVTTLRDGLLASMGLVTPINLTDTVANMFLDSPQVLTSTLL